MEALAKSPTLLEGCKPPGIVMLCTGKETVLDFTTSGSCIKGTILMPEPEEPSENTRDPSQDRADLAAETTTGTKEPGWTETFAGSIKIPSQPDWPKTAITCSLGFESQTLAFAPAEISRLSGETPRPWPRLQGHRRKNKRKYLILSSQKQTGSLHSFLIQRTEVYTSYSSKAFSRQGL